MTDSPPVDKRGLQSTTDTTDDEPENNTSDSAEQTTDESLSKERTHVTAEEAKAVAGNSQQKIEVIESKTDDTPGDVPDEPTNTHSSHPEPGYPDAEGEDVEISLTQVDYTTREQNGREFAVLHIFGRNADNHLEHIEIPNFEPYFYVPTGKPAKKARENSHTTRIEHGYETIRGRDVVRVYTELPKHLGYMRDDFDEHYEADIRFPNRFLLDHDIYNGIRVPQRRTDPDEDGNRKIVIKHDEAEAIDMSVTPRTLTFDLEVEDRNGFPEDGDEPIVCLTSHDNYNDEYVVWHAESDEFEGESPTEFPGYQAIDEDKDLTVSVKTFDEEAGMLDSFLSYIEQTDPDILTGWNFEDFDAPYLIDRLEQINDTTDHDLWKGRLARIGVPYTTNWGPTIKGRVVMDLLYAYKRTQFSEKESYRLDAIGEAELGVGKEHYSGKIGDLWEDDPETLLEYNLRDVEICVELDEQQEIIPFWDEVRSFVGCLIEDAPTPSDACDMYVLHKVNGGAGNKPQYVLPSKGQAEEEEYEGGAVFDAISGVRENVTVLDLKSLYPMCMVTINASPDTKVDPETFEGETFEAPNGIHFRKDKEGVIRSIIDELLAEREQKKELRGQHDPGSDEFDKFDRQQASVKVIMNSLYGVLGWERFRLYDKEMGAAVTATGRGVIEFTETVVEEEGLEVTYGDTDSVMLELGQLASEGVPIPDEMRAAHPDMDDDELRTIAACLDTSFELEDIINNRYDDYAKNQLNADEHRLQIEFEKLYRRFFQAGKKKRYAGHIVWKEGIHVDKVDITGFESERSDIAAVTKEVQTNVIDMIVHGVDHDEIKSYVHEIIQDVRNGDIDPDQVGIPGGIGQNLNEYDTKTAQVRGAMYANMLMGTNFGKGSKPKRLYLKKVHPDYWGKVEAERNLETQSNKTYADFKRDPDVICYEYAEDIPSEFQIDWDTMLSKTLQSPISRVLEPIGISWQDAKSGQTQMGIGQFT